MTDGRAGRIGRFFRNALSRPGAGVAVPAPVVPQPVIQCHEWPTNGCEEEFVAEALRGWNTARNESDAAIQRAQAEVQKLTDDLDRLVKFPKSALVLQEKGKTETSLKSACGRLMHLVQERDIGYSTEIDFRLQYQRIVEMPRLKYVRIRDGRLEYLTRALYSFDMDRKWHRIGPFKISFRIAKPVISDCRYTNLEGVMNGYHGPANIAEVPNQDYGYITCPGDLAVKTFNRAIRHFDYEAIVGFSIRYPECSGITGVAMKWPVVEARRLPSWYVTTFGSSPNMPDETL